MHYHDWISNPVMVKKHGGSWRMCIDFTDLNKSCPKDCYPLPEIDWKVESVYGYPFKCFLDAYKGYHQIQMAEEDEEKIAFHTNQGVFSYTKMPFGLKNAGATYQRLVDKAFEKQIGRNLEVYVDNLGIKACLEKVEAVMKLQSPQTLKEAQSLNEKLASLNRFLSKSAERSLPFFKTLKKCVKKSDFQWTPEAEKAFQNMKKCIAELPMVTAPKPKEELTMYLCAAREAISAVFLTERDSRQIPIYFGSRALQAPEINYNSIKKVVLALVHATRRLRSENASRRNSSRAMDPIHGRIIMEGLGAGFILTSPEGEEFTYALRFEFDASNNEAEYEALIACLRTAEQMGIENLTAKVDSRLVPRSKNKKADALSKIASTSFAHLTKQVLVNPKKKVNRREGNLSNSGRRRVLMDDTADRIPHGKNLTSGNKKGPFPEGQGKVKFFIVSIDYFTKWIEAKPVATITGSQVKKFVWDNIVCRFGLPREIISDNRKPFRDNPFKD
ncbi:reverse transcriptase domain-containing protein [Tanacetum coccineum]